MSKSYKYDDRVAQLYQAGMSIPAVAKTVKIGNKSVMDALKRKGVEIRRRGPIPRLSDPKVLELALSGLTVKQIATEMKCSRQTVYKHLKATGAQSVIVGKYTDDQIVSLHQDGLTDADIATELGVCIKTVLVTRKRLGLNSYPGVAPILSVVEVDRLLSLARQGWTQINLAKEFGIAQKTVSNYLIKYGVRRYKQHTRKAKQ